MEVPLQDHRRRAILTSLGSSIALSGCLGRIRSRQTPQSTLTVAVTTSVADTGVLDAVHATFESSHECRVLPVIGGTGENIRAGKRGDVDCIMAHAPALEDEFIRSGHGVDRVRFMNGSFAVLGPQSDAADVQTKSTAVDAFRSIAEKQLFVSRGDNSGTHHAEKQIWEMAGIKPTGEWYRELGQGMGSLLIHADRRDAYCLSVFETYRAMSGQLSLQPYLTIETDQMLHNPYSLLLISSDRHPDRNHELALAYQSFLTSDHGQALLSRYEIDGQTLFSPLSETV